MRPLEQYKAILSRLKPELEKRYHVSSIGLFGSVVRDDFSITNSDVDVIVDFREPVGIEFIELADYLEQEFHRKVDLVSVRGVKPQYLKAIESQIVYV